MFSSKRIIKEYKDITTSDECIKNGITLKLKKNNDYTKWEAYIFGPTKSPYEDGKFLLDISIPSDYPFKPPKIKFITRIFHPNINSTGEICIDTLKNNWSPSLTLDKVLLSIIALLDNPNPDDPLDAEAASLYKNDRNKYNEKIRNMIKKNNN
jgi:ubiquitin-conjugating enzyme E2 D/E